MNIYSSINKNYHYQNKLDNINFEIEKLLSEKDRIIKINDYLDSKEFNKFLSEDINKITKEINHIPFDSITIKPSFANTFTSSISILLKFDYKSKFLDNIFGSEYFFEDDLIIDAVCLKQNGKDFVYNSIEDNQTYDDKIERLINARFAQSKDIQPVIQKIVDLLKQYPNLYCNIGDSEYSQNSNIIRFNYNLQMSDLIRYYEYIQLTDEVLSYNRFVYKHFGNKRTYLMESLVKALFHIFKNHINK